MSGSPRHHHHRRGRPIGRRKLIGGLVALVGAGVGARLLDMIGAGSSSAATGTGLNGRTEPDAVLPATTSTSSGAGSTTWSFVSRPDLAPPRVLVDTDLTEDATRLIATDCHGGHGQQGPLLIGPHGDLVWFRSLSDNGSTTRRAFNVRVQTYRGAPVITYFDGEVVDGHGRGVYRLLDDHYRLVTTVRAHNGMMGDLHEFVLTPEGTALFTAYGTASADLTAVGGSGSGQYFYGEVQEVDVATGKLLFSWRSDRHVDLAESYYGLPSNGTPWDYFHINSINVDPGDGNLIVSSRCCWAFYKIHRKSGEILWRLGGKKSDFSIGSGAQFAWQHDVTPLGNGVFTVFDNESGGPPGKPSRGLVISVDETARTATFAGQYGHNPALHSGVLGSMQTLPDGRRFVGWGTTTYFTEYDHDGRAIFDAHLDGEGLESYRAFVSTWDAVPTEPPAVVAYRRSGSTVIHVSWNGATRVARWRVLAGTSTSPPVTVGVAPRKGFETVVTLTAEHDRVQVEALDDSDRALHRSEVVDTTTV